MSRPLFFFTSVFSASVFLAQLPYSAAVRLCLMLLFCITGIYAATIRFGRKEALVFLFAALSGAGWFFAYGAAVYGPVASLDGYQGEIAAEITSYPESDITYSSADARLLSPEAGSLISSPRITLYVEDGSSDLSPGDIVVCDAELRLPKSSAGFDYAAYLRGKGVFLTAYQTGGYRVEKAGKLPFRYYPALIRKKLGGVIDRLGGENSGLMKALITGDKSGIDARLKVSLSNTGTSHIAVVSGMHIAFLTGILLRIFGNGAGQWITFPVILLFMAITGFSPSVVRAGTMHMLMLVSPLFRREADSLTSLGTALFLLLLINPFAVKDVGLLLSFGATLGIILFSDSLNQALLIPASRLPKYAKKVFDPALSIVSTTISASVFTLPLAGLYFGRFSLISPLSNLLVLPVVSLAFSLLLLSAVLGLFLPAPAAVLIKAPALLTGFIVKALHGLSRFPYAFVPSDDVFFVIFAAFVYFAVFIYVVSENKRRAVLSSAAACALVFSTAVWFSGKLGEGEMKTAVLGSDYGGRCIVVSCGKNAVVIDCGSGKYSDRADYATDYLLKNGIRRIDALVVTSFDPFHAGAVSELIGTHTVGKIILFPPDGSDVCRDITKSAGEYSIPIYTFSKQARQKEGSISYTLYPAEDGSAIVKLPSKNGEILIATVKNGYALAHLAQNEEAVCDILIMDRSSAAEAAAVKLISEFCRPKAMVLVDEYPGSEAGFGDFKGALYTTAVNGTVSIVDRF